MKRDNTESKKSAFRELRELGYVNDEIRRALGCSERTLYRWAAEDEDESYQKETEQKIDEKEQVMRKEIDELKEHIERLSQYYTNLWNQAHLQQKQPVRISPFQLFFETMMENSEKNRTILSQQMERCREFEAELAEKEGRDSKPDIYPDLHFNEHIEQMKQWNKRFDIEDGRIPAESIETEDTQRNKEEPQLMMETAEGRRFERNIADRCFKRNVEKIVDRAFRKNPRNSQ